MSKVTFSPPIITNGQTLTTGSGNELSAQAATTEQDEVGDNVTDHYDVNVSYKDTTNKFGGDQTLLAYVEPHAHYLDHGDTADFTVNPGVVSLTRGSDGVYRGTLRDVQLNGSEGENEPRLDGVKVGVYNLTGTADSNYRNNWFVAIGAAFKWPGQ